MADREKVITDAEEAIKILDMIDEPTPWCDFVRIAFEHALELMKGQETVNGWVSAKDGLPDETEDVIICYEWVGFSGIKYREVTVNDLREVKQISDRIIAWMPLPEPPKEDDA